MSEKIDRTVTGSVADKREPKKRSSWNLNDIWNRPQKIHMMNPMKKADMEVPMKTNVRIEPMFRKKDL